MMCMTKLVMHKKLIIFLFDNTIINFNYYIMNSKLKQLIKEFNIQHITKNNTFYLHCLDLKNKLHLNSANELFLDEDNKYTETKKNADGELEAYLESDIVIKLLKQSKNHPEHYNAQKILGFDIKYKKQQEIETLAPIYKYFRHEYNIVYQYQFLEFKLDANIMIELNSNGGLVIEIDENNHGNYDKKDNEERQSILESCGFHFIRVIPNMHSSKELINIIENEINEYELLYSIDVDPDKLWIQLQDKSIDKDFFNFIGKSIVCNKRFCVDFNDVFKYLGYTRKDHAKHMLLEKFKNKIDYVVLKHNAIDHHDDVYVVPRKKRERNLSTNALNRLEYIFLTKFAFYTFALLSNTRKGKQIRTWIVEVYNKYQEILVSSRQKMIKLKQEQNGKIANELYNKRNDEKLQRYKNNKKKELNNANQALSYYKKECNYYKTICDENKSEFDNYNELFKEQENIICKQQSEIEFFIDNNKTINLILIVRNNSTNLNFIKKCDDIIKKILLIKLTY
jgi:prophage antirepressor-like protein